MLTALVAARRPVSDPGRHHGGPGAAKSTLIETLGLNLIAAGPPRRRAGDRPLQPGLRRRQYPRRQDPDVCTGASKADAFVRPLLSGPRLAGVARNTREAMIACEAAGFDVVLVETVVVGQAETAVADMVDFFLARLVAGAGDEFQGMKERA